MCPPPVAYRRGQGPTLARDAQRRGNAGADPGGKRELRRLLDSAQLDQPVHIDAAIAARMAHPYTWLLGRWLTTSTTISARTRTFARHSAIGSLLLGMAGQIAYHLLAQNHTTHAPWAIATAVSCPPVLVLGMGAALTHLLHGDAHSPLVRPTVPGPDQRGDRSECRRPGRGFGPARPGRAYWHRRKPLPPASRQQDGAYPGAPCAPPASAPPTPNSAR